MFIRARVEFARIEQATLVPITALVRRDGKQGVFLVESDGAQEPVLRARFVPVTTGIVSGEVAEVKEPALSGAVVTLGNHLLEDGAKVMLPKPPAEAAGNRAKEGAGR